MNRADKEQMFNFSPEVQKVLSVTGWFPTRSVQTHQWINPLVKVGYRPFPNAIRVLENLGGLEIAPPSNESNLFFPGTIIFDPLFAASSEFDRVERWQTEYDLALFPLGEYDPIYMLLCSEDGRIFGAREQWFYLLGETIEDALEIRIFAKRRPLPYIKREK